MVHLEAVVYDMDGLMIDSEPLWHVAEKAAFAEVGLHLTTEDCIQTTGLRIDAVVEHWFKKCPWDEAKTLTQAQMVERILDHMVRQFRERGKSMAKPGLYESIEFFRGKGYRLGLATSSATVLLDAALGVLELKGTFEVTCSAQNLRYGKPHPEVYLLCADKLGVDPTHCIALEDSVNGVIAAKAARMRCFAVPEFLPPSPKFQIADVVLESLLEVNDATVAQALA
eukprot:comp48248_c0_seq1/m.47616 comp48248_c0_seq1/g.47616  ORF comp48248_c0_seq1/g.47616 comp48248_c0_seq1/m.47616 type:complete len:226 (-) comp48248_c0_seq1:583-1260(-)